MRLVRLIYASKPSLDIGLEVAKQINSEAGVNNRTLGVTGVLVYDRKYFVQCLEGDRTQVNRLYHKIAGDQRHSDIMILDYDEISQRDFTHWDMGFVTTKEANRELFLRYCGVTEFSPYGISGKAALNFLKEMREKILP